MKNNTARIKLAPRSTIAQEEAGQILIDLSVQSNEKRRLTAAMDAKILEVRNEFQARLDACDKAIAVYAEYLEDFALSNPEIFPKDRKSVEWTGGKMGFRTSTPSLALLNRKVNWAQVLAIVTLRRFRKFMRIKKEVDKEAILARCGTVEKPTRFQTKVLPMLGLKLVQDEAFYVEPALTDTEVKS